MLPALPRYPGRGITVLRDPSGQLWWSYFLTGRSEASRNRTLRVEQDRIVVAPRRGDPEDALRHYSCLRAVGADLIIGNGDHIDHFVDALTSERSFTAALDATEPEPDPPIHTPRLAMLVRADADLVRCVAVARAQDAIRRTNRTFALSSGQGVLLHTYGGDEVVVTTDAEPRRFGPTSSDPRQLARALWDGLAPTLRVAVAMGRVPFDASDVVVFDEH